MVKEASKTRKDKSDGKQNSHHHGRFIWSHILGCSHPKRYPSKMIYLGLVRRWESVESPCTVAQRRTLVLCLSLFLTFAGQMAGVSVRYPRLRTIIDHWSPCGSESLRSRLITLHRPKCDPPHNPQPTLMWLGLDDQSPDALLALSRKHADG